MKAISTLHFITTNAEAAEKACAGGVDWVQLRLKNVSHEAYRSVALEVQAVCKKYGATFIVNDNVALAKEIAADGVHIGKEDMSPDSTRKLLGDSFIVGCTANTVEDVSHLSEKPIDYIGLGPYRFTSTKEKLSPVLGLNGYRKIFNQLQSGGIQYPAIIGIGGIATDDVSVLMSTGLHGIAVASAIASAPDIATAAANFKDLLNPANKQVNKSVTINAPAAKVWEAITTPAMISKWFTDTPVDVVTNWREGSAITFKGMWHNKPYEHRGTILQHRPQQLLSYTNWNTLSSLPDVPENYSTIVYKLETKGEQTELTVIQSNFTLDTVYRHFNYFWTLTLDRLKKLTERL